MTKKNNYHDVYIGIGSNIENPIKQVNAAFTELKNLPYCIWVIASSLYRTPPLGPQNQPHFINAVVKLQTQLEPEILLLELKTLEEKRNRVYQQHWGPRILDLDILLYDHVAVTTATLSIPHPELQNRNFVLIPLHEIAPDLILPNGKKIAELVKHCEKITKINF